jgi:formylglycine-generating enzyme required for sulfatase activity
MKLQWSKTFDRMDWYDAMKFCEELDFEGHGDWRLPTRAELIALYDSDENPHETADLYWSSADNTDNTDNAWLVDFSDGNVYNDAKTLTLYVRAVRERKEGE